MITPRGDIASPIWAILDKPSEADNGAGVPLSGTEGYHFNKLFDELELPQPYITTVEENNVITYDSNNSTLISFLTWLSRGGYTPTIMLLVGAKSTELFCPETKNYKKPHDTKLDKWAGSLLISPLLKWAHYCIPLWPVSQFFIDWSYRDIYKYIDLGKAKDELSYVSTTGSLNPLPVYNINTSPSFHETLDFLDYCTTVERCGCDIETIRLPKNRSIINGSANYFYTISLAANKREAIAFSLWRWPADQITKIWRKLNYVLKHTPIVGQNFIQFDCHFLEAHGLEPDLSRIFDTRIGHHIAWPELPHSLQFLTKQYTRQKFYKDEGKTWSPKQLTQLLHYNALDSLVLHPIHDGIQEELRERNLL